MRLDGTPQPEGTPAGKGVMSGVMKWAKKDEGELGFSEFPFVNLAVPAGFEPASLA